MERERAYFFSPIIERHYEDLKHRYSWLVPLWFFREITRNGELKFSSIVKVNCEWTLVTKWCVIIDTMKEESLKIIFLMLRLRKKSFSRDRFFLLFICFQETIFNEINNGIARSKFDWNLCYFGVQSLIVELLLGNQDQRSHPIVRILLGFTSLPFLFFSLSDPSTKILSSFPSLPSYIHSPILSKRFPRLSTETELPTTFAFSLSRFYNIIRHTFHDESYYDLDPFLFHFKYTKFDEINFIN